jgi:hypothetical protein
VVVGQALVVFLALDRLLLLLEPPIKAVVAVLVVRLLAELLQVVQVFASFHIHQLLNVLQAET